MKILGILCFIVGILLLYLQGKILTNSLIYSIAAFALFSLGSNLFRAGKQREQPLLDTKLLHDNRKPILLLRSFKRDDTYINRGWNWRDYSMFHSEYYVNRVGITFEEELSKRFDKIGPVIALGRPGEKLQPLGASRGYAPHSDWKDTIIYLINRSLFVFIILDFSESMVWELDMVIEKKGKTKLVILLPPIYSFYKNDEEWYTHYETLRNNFHFLPEVDKTVLAIYFDKDDNSYIIQSDSDNNLKKIKMLEDELDKDEFLLQIYTY